MAVALLGRSITRTTASGKGLRDCAGAATTCGWSRSHARVSRSKNGWTALCRGAVSAAFEWVAVNERTVCCHGSALLANAVMVRSWHGSRSNLRIQRVPINTVQVNTLSC